ncbi:MAG TPA: SRPBCC family protein [Acidobacteriaceae bacterium]|nr:SRPBCC family protein [Acidobacteriaceae bacterium]
MVEGATIAYSLRIHGLSVQWLSRIECWDPPFSFVDVQLKGPYRLWRHTHSFVSREGSTVIADSVEFALPFGVLGDIVYRIQVERDIRRIFDYREQRVKERFNSQ